MHLATDQARDGCRSFSLTVWFRAGGYSHSLKSAMLAIRARRAPNA